MKLAPFLAFLLLAACGPASATNKVPGTYVVDTKALIANIPATDKEEAKKNGVDTEKMIAGMFEGTSMELLADGTATMKGPMAKGEEGKGTWKLDGDKITITTKGESKTGKFDNGTITLDLPDGRGPKQLIFRKK